MDYKHATSEVESMAIDLEGRSWNRGNEVKDLWKHVLEMEDRKKELCQKVKTMKDAETDRAQTSFNMDMGEKQ